VRRRGQETNKDAVPGKPVFEHAGERPGNTVNCKNKDGQTGQSEPGEANL